MFIQNSSNKMYKCDKDEIIDLVKNMNDIYQIYINGNYNPDFIINMNFKELDIYKKLIIHYNALKLSSINYRIRNEMGNDIISLLEKNKNIFEEFDKCIYESRIFYENAYENNFIDYPYNLVSKESRKKIINDHNSLNLKDIFG